MIRCGCFEIRTSCASCGQSLPVNGPFRQLSCSACLEDMNISEDILAGFLNDFEEEYDSLAEGQGRGGTLMSGRGTFKYGYWKLMPRCISCRKPLSLPEVHERSVLRCDGCDAVYHLFPPPEWLQKKVPSADFIITKQPPPGEDGKSTVKVDEMSSEPVVMSCPKCAAALSISSESERIMKCVYCNSEVYIPDALWKRLHPVSKTEEWFVCFEGKNCKQLQSERRLQDQKEEKEALSIWRLKNAPKKVGGKIRSFFGPFLILAAIIALAILLISLIGNGKQSATKEWDDYAPFIIIPVTVLLPLFFVFRTTFSANIGKGRKCKKALGRLAHKHNWKHEGAEYRSSLGYINAKYLGRDIEINPGDEFAIEVEINDSPFYLKTEPPGYPQESVQRFSSGDSRFDNLFPIRYAKPELAERIEISMDEARAVLAPVYWFLNRWQRKLGILRIDWSSAAVHLAPGHVDVLDTGNRYLLPEDIEPLLEDMIVLANGIDAVASSREPELP
jgi:hypothetical protein